jgi:hypothetical protein
MLYHQCKSKGKTGIKGNEKPETEVCLLCSCNNLKDATTAVYMLDIIH